MEPWKPDRKIVTAAIAAILAWLAQVILGVEMPPGIEAAVAVVVAYLIPSTRQQPIEDREE